ncbi:28S ribosomal protein S9, mitochondrial-like [Pollicipes pollicipes]|uniref:28S ribosomal protein S9, mitochondrial-like n=1 Tax=Pollicipes pollicipes TaxID=41117 RepID=UPI0018857493|nr:28S ribosomal protein S9, mitochondrial-like [Pollicipes pollicipes]
MSLGRLRVLEMLRRATLAPLAGLRPSLCQPLTTAVTEDPLDHSDQPTDPATTRKTSKAMMAYMERAAKHEEFMRKEISEFEIGKRHLANMMGEDPEHFTQRDIDRSIRYLFPTGIFDKKARPRMLHPSEVFPQQKEAQFDETGRPFHSLFYTLKPNFYMTLYDLVERLNQLDKLESKNVARGQLPDPSQKLSLLGSEWLNVVELGKTLLEPLNEHQYQEFIRAMNRLVEHPLSYHQKDFIFKYRKTLQVTSKVEDVPELMFDADGRPYMEADGFRKKLARARVTVRGRGSGRVTVNGIPLLQYFWRNGSRSGNQDVAQVMFPLQVAGLLDAVDVEATVRYAGPVQRYADRERKGQPHPVQAPSAQAGALRHGVAVALRSFVDKDMQETMRIAGLLTRDVRTRERYKPGKKGARKGRTWKKR